MAELPWFKVYTEALHDPKFVVAATDNQMEEMTVFGIWMALLCIAARSPIRGHLTASNNRNYTIEQLDMIIGYQGSMATGDLHSLLDSFIDLDMIGIDENGAYYIVNFETRQETKEERKRRLNNERQKRYQQAHKSDSVNNNVINNAPLTQDSSSSSSSISLINKDSLTENNAKTLFTFGDASRAICKVANWISTPGDWSKPIEATQDYLQNYGWDQTLTDLKIYADDWVSHKRQDNGANYSLMNPQWVYRMAAHEPIGKPQQMTEEERFEKAAAELRKEYHQ